MKIVIVGSGGREHAMGWAFYREGYDVYYVPGNPGTARHGTNIAQIPDEEDILVIPGSETYIAGGIADGKDNVFAPDSRGARLESSKIWAKEFMKKHGIPTAPFIVVNTPKELKTALKSFSPPYVIKADGLAGGKGVIIEDDFEKAVEKGSMLIEGTFLKGVKGPVVVEEYLPGIELSAMAVASGEHFALFPFTRDYKRAYDGGKGPNTGGMGAVGPINVDKGIVDQIEDIYRLTLDGLKSEGISYKGFLYIGLMIKDDKVYVLEYNVRMGDPETEVIVMMNPSGFVSSVLSAYRGESIQPIVPKCFAVDVVIASEGYPLSPRKGQVIEKEPTGFAFYAGVKEESGKLVVSGGRVFHCMGTGMTPEEARTSAYRCAESVSFPGAFFRRDIGELIER
ncbi:phosphoribosylamine--glycine ligase [bacterium 3DAC]|nr:phosphoribosylamine--glycine ligase [bacterium 3DAC]